ncbi:hypothetical protein QLQ85_08885 [Halomonas sp. M4R5S39]|uniref:hypothetical protein n=1 Tax=Halomonas kalidii TaxID=3043293 RepID=UPI0024A7C23C|nr:hypothetical protein [Halomonas kalidii]MDI5984905.1 hypothetical protein [Halomonas kalidii]
MSNPSLGTIDCPTCSTAGADVRQTKRRGAHLYWQCADCGLMQPTGAAIQGKLWRNTDWHAGAEPLRPANVPATLERSTPEEFDPAKAEPEPDEPTTAAATHRPSPAKGVGVLLLGALGLGLFLASQ